MALTSRLEVEIDSRDAEQKANALRDSLSQLEASGNLIDPSLKKASKGMDDLGKSTKKTTTSTKEQIAELDALLGRLDPLRKKQDELAKSQAQLYAAFKNGDLNEAGYKQFSGIIRDQVTAINASRTALTGINADLSKTGMTAKATAAALRGVPAQFTDIAVSLQGGQAPLTVFLQQGGQLKDMFGGAGPAAKALSGYILGLVNPLTAAAAAAGALAIAYKQGSDEATAFQTALTLTGNAAGTTSGQLAAIAVQVAKTSGTVGAASDTLAQLAASTRIPVASFELLATAAVKMESATGQAANDTVANFEKLAKDPVKASLALNESLGYLTASTFEQITALERQGETQAAATLAEEAYAKGLVSRADTIKSNLGSIESGWASVKNAAKGAWDAILDIGREATFDEKMAGLQEQLANASRLGGGSRGGGGRGQEQVQADITSLIFDEQDKKRRAASKALYQQIQQDGIAAEVEIGKIREQTQSNAAKREKEITKYRKDIEDIRKANPNSALLDEKKITQDIADINEKYADKKVKAAKAYVEDAGQKMLDNARQQYSVLQQQGVLISQQGAGAKALGTEAKKLLELEQQIAQLKEKSTLTTAQKQILAMADLNIAQQKQNALKEKENELTTIALANSAKLLAFQENLNSQLDLSREGLSNQLAGIGLGKEGEKRLQDDLKIRQDYQKQLTKLTYDYNKIVNPTTADKDVYDQETAKVRDALEERLAMQQNYYVSLDRAQTEWMNGANAAFQDYADEAANISGQTYDLVSNGLGELEDQFVSVFTTGKFSFKDLANSIIADLARMLAKAYVVMPILGALGLSGSSGGGGVAGAWSSITGGEGGGGGITSMISSAKTVIDVASSKFGESLINGWNSGGESLVDSLSGAFDGGASYVGDAISSAFTAGSATASVAAEATAATFSAGITESAAAIGSQFSAEIGGAAISYEAASAASANALSSTLGTLSTALSVIGTAYTVFTAFQDYGVEGGLTTAGFAAAGAAIGSVVPVIGTAIGAAIGAVIGSIASASWFGGPNYEQLVSSAEGSYSDGKFKDEGWYDGWKENKTRLGAGTDGKLMSYVQQFTSTMGMLYDALGDGSDVSAAVTMRRRETSGDWSNGMAATLDNGVQITALKQYGLDVEENLTAYYDDFMGTFLAQAIVSSESLPQYFKNQFEAYSTDWEVSADTVIAAIEGVFTRFNGVNSALGQINVTGLKLNETGMIASDSILNMVASLADLDSESATAKEKVDALNELVNSYYSVFFTADEQFADLTSSLKGSFAGFGLALPDTREAYRAMVEDIDVTTSAGQAMFATMMGLATAADSYYSTVAKNQANYYDLFTSDGQKATDTLASVGAQFKELGLALPANREGFVAMVGSIDQTTEKGKALFASLLGLATNADAAFDIMEQQSAATAQAISESLLNGVTSAQSALQRAVTAQQKIVTAAYNDTTQKLNTSLTAANTNVNDLTSVSNDLSSALKSLRGDSDEAVKMLRAQAVATLQSALATARAGGSLSGFKGLDDALDTVSSNNTDLYSSMEDFARDQGRTAGVIAELEAINGKQLTSAEKTVKALEDQLKLAEDSYKLQMDRFDSQLEFAQAQVDAINGVDTSIMGVTAAVNAMNAAVVAALGTVTGANPTNSGTLIDTAYQNTLGQNADSAGKDYWQGQLNNGAISYDQLAGAIKNAATENAIKDAYKDVLGQAADAAGAAYWAGQVSSGALTISQLEQAIKNAAIANGSVKAYATGGLISGQGTGTSDSIMARLSNGEYVMTADSVRMFGTGLLDQMNAGKAPGFASGGEIRLVGTQSSGVRGGSAIPGVGRSASAYADSNGAVVAELRALGERLDNIEANTQAGALNASNLLKTFNRVTDGGNAMLTKAA